jgi:hypothetical protein
MGHFSERDYGPSYGAALTVDVLRVWNIIQEFRVMPTTDQSASS